MQHQLSLCLFASCSYSSLMFSDSFTLHNPLCFSGFITLLDIKSLKKTNISMRKLVKTFNKFWWKISCYVSVPQSTSHWEEFVGVWLLLYQRRFKKAIHYLLLTDKDKMRHPATGYKREDLRSRM